MYENQLELDRDRDMLKYNAENAVDRADNDAIQTQELRQIWKDLEVKVAKKASYYAAGQSLLNFGKAFI